MHKKISINKREIFMLFLLIPFIKLPDYIVGVTINNLFDILKLVSFVIITALTIKNKKINKIIILFIIFQFILLLSTIINNNADKIWTQFIQFFSCLGIIMYANYFISMDIKKFYKVVSKYICFLALINSITMFIYYPNGMYTDFRLDNNYYFLQLDNISFFTVYIGLICMIIYSKLKYNKVNIYSYIFLIIQFISYFYVRSTTAYVLILLLIIMTFVIEKTKIKLNFNILIFLIAIFTFSISVLKVQNYFPNIINNLLDKDLTFSGRTLIWDRTLEYIKLKPLLGYGLESGAIMIIKVGFNHIHNIFIEILYKGGLIALISYILIIRELSKKMKLIKNDRKNYNLLTFFFIIFLLICQFDYYNDIYICFIIYIIIYHCSLLIGENHK